MAAMELEVWHPCERLPQAFVSHVTKKQLVLRNLKLALGVFTGFLLKSGVRIRAAMKLHSGSFDRNL